VNTGLFAGATYYYVVTATNPAGTSVNSAQASATTSSATAPPAAPTGVKAQGGNASVVLNWYASSGSTSYNVLRNGALAASTAAITYTDTGRLAGTAYTYNIQAVSAAGTSANSATVSATTNAGLAAPPTITRIYSATTVSLTWTAVTGATSYNIGTGATAAGPFTVLSSVATTSGSYTATGAATLYYAVSTVNAAGQGAWSLGALPTKYSCFTAGTRVLMADGRSLPIELVRAGDKILAYDDATGKTAMKPVSRLFVHPLTSGLVSLDHGRVTTTLDHLFKTGSGWVNARDMRSGDVLTMASPSNALGLGTVSSIEVLDGTATTYNLEVEDFHTYFVNGFLVHD
jgi:hypothetical protein